MVATGVCGEVRVGAQAGFWRWAALLLGATLAIAGCDDDSGGTTTDPDADAGNDTSTGDQGTNDTADTEVNSCGEATSCAGNGDCADDEICVGGCCEDRPVVENCTSQGQACTSEEFTNENFVCDTGLQQCLARCDSSTTDSSQEGSCTSGGWCFGLTSGGVGALDGVCLRGDCNDECFDPADCPEGTPFSCADETGTCLAFGNGASFCFPAGTGEPGDECTSVLVCGPDDDPETTGCAEDPTDVCAPGVMCFNGICEAPCNPEAEDSGCGDEECVQAFDSAGDNVPGICGSSCDPFSRDQCDEGQGCEVLVGGRSGSMLGWLCTDLLEDEGGDLVPVVAIGEACDPDGEDGFDNQCAEGSLCFVEFDTDTVGTCTQLCDFTLENESASARCTAALPGAPLLLDGETAAYADAGEVVGYLAVAAASGLDLQLWTEPEGEDDPVSLASASNVTLAADTASTLIAHYDADGAVAVTTVLDWDNETEVIPENESGVRVHNVSDIAVNLHPVEPLILNLGPGESTTEDEQLTFNDVYTNIVVSGDGWANVLHIPAAEEPTGFLEAVAIEDLAVDAPAPVMLVGFPTVVPDGLDLTGAAVRIINGSVRNPTLDADFSPAGMTDIVDLPYGEASAEDTGWSVNEIEDGATENFTITIADGTDDEFVVAIDNAARGDVYTVVIWDGGEAGETIEDTHPGVGEAAEGDIAYRLTNLTDLTISVGVEGNEPLELAAGASEPATTGVVEGIVGDFMVVVRDGDAEVPLGAVPLASSDWLEIVAGDLLTGVVAHDDADGFVLFMDVGAEPDLAGLGDAEALVRFFNAVPGAAALRLETLGEALEVCAPLAVEGLGACEQRCNPYLLGTAYVDESGDATDRWENNGCTHREDVGYACFPFVTTGDQDTPMEEEGAPDLEGFCVPRPLDDATGGFGDSCTSDAACNPDSWCFDLFGTGDGQCTKLCVPFAGDGDADCSLPNFCYGLGPQEWGICLEPTVDLEEGDPCTQGEDLVFCSDNDTICVSSGAAASCTRLCKSSLEDSCPNEAASDCQTGIFAGVPEWFGACFAE